MIGILPREANFLTYSVRDLAPKGAVSDRHDPNKAIVYPPLGTGRNHSMPDGGEAGAAIENRGTKNKEVRGAGNGQKQ
jgi:hypothetical protein